MTELNTMEQVLKKISDLRDEVAKIPISLELAIYDHEGRKITSEELYVKLKQVIQNSNYIQSGLIKVEKAVSSKKLLKSMVKRMK